MHPKHMFDKKTLLLIVLGGLYSFVSTSKKISILRHITSSPRTSNLQDWTVSSKVQCTNLSLGKTLFMLLSEWYNFLGTLVFCLI